MAVSTDVFDTGCELLNMLLTDPRKNINTGVAEVSMAVPRAAETDAAVPPFTDSFFYPHMSRREVLAPAILSYEEKNY